MKLTPSNISSAKNSLYPLTILMLVRDHGDIRQSLSSLTEPYHLLIGDQGMSLGNRQAAQDLGCEPLLVPQDRSQALNQLVALSDSRYLMRLDPWERMVSGSLGDLQESIYSFRVVRGDMVTTEPRVWRRDCMVSFKNPVFETNGLVGGRVIATILSESIPIDLAILEEWSRRCRTDPESHYFYAFGLLSAGRMDEFEAEANQYLFRENDPHAIKPVTMTRYYLGLMALRRRDISEAVKMAVACLAARVNMAEFWCFLGDIHYHLFGAYDRAFVFYENAVILGSRRRSDDGWPMQISKYQEYPQEMMKSCQEILVSRFNQQTF